uniref:CCHC-type domain-containing protein n=1 Tax=Cajanus cajan TaxID=3821 RepID=A0A151TAM6_CAJCA|nr:hypothetical protein KK1_018675 [Cajanus cajan]
MVKFDSTNYSIGKSRMEDLLFCKDLYDPIEVNGTKPADKSKEKCFHCNKVGDVMKKCRYFKRDKSRGRDNE